MRRSGTIILAAITAVAITASPALGDRGTMLAFSESGNSVPQYAFWNGTVWDDELDTTTVGTEPNFVVIRSCPTRSEMAIGTLDGDKDVNVLFHDGASWSAVTEVCDDAEYNTERCVDLGYEQLSGDLMIAYWDKARGQISYRTYDGTTLSGESELVIPKKPRWVRLYPKAGTDEIMLAALGDDKAVYVSHWSGSTWSAMSTATTDTGYTDHEPFDFAWEGLSGDGLLAYGNNANEPRYRTWNGTTWSGESSMPSVGKKQRWIRLAADPESDQILFASLDDDKDVNANVWSGTAWGTNQELEDNAKDRTERRYDLTYVRGGGTAIIGYSETGTKSLRYRTWNGSSWSGESSGPDLGDDLIVISAVPGVRAGEVLFLASDNGSDLNSMYWDGTTMTTQEVEGGVGGSDTEAFMIASNLGQGTALMVVNDPATIAAEDEKRRKRFQSWGWVVPYIDEADTQGNFDTAVAGAHVAYVPENVASTTLQAKLTNAPIGVLIEEGDSFDYFELIDVNASDQSATQIDVQTADHHITSNLSTGNTTLFTSSQSLNSVTSHRQHGLSNLAEYPGIDDMALIAIDWCDEYDGRRVFLPWGNGAFDWDTGNANFIEVADRAMEWGGALMARWKLDETSGTTADDTSVRTNDATLSGLTFAASVTGRVGTALLFDGTNDHATFADLELYEGPFTVCVWIKASDLSAADATHGMGIIRSTTGESVADFFLAVDDDGAVHFANWRSAGNDADGVAYTSDGAVSENAWTHIVASWDGTTNRIFVNGVDQGILSTEATSTGWGTERSIGRNSTGAGDHFTGVIDDVRIYRQAVLPAEADRLYRGCGYRMTTWQEVQPD